MSKAENKSAPLYVTIVSFNWADYSEAEQETISHANNHIVANVPEGRFSFKILGVFATKSAAVVVKYLETISDTDVELELIANKVVSASIEIPQTFCL